jgi:hypothetical protein
MNVGYVGLGTALTLLTTVEVTERSIPALLLDVCDTGISLCARLLYFLAPSADVSACDPISEYWLYESKLWLGILNEEAI